MCNRDYNFVTPFDFYKNKKSHVYSRDKYGFRGRYKDLNEIDILAVGGSTTDERFLKLNDTWVEKLESNFINDSKNIDIVNAGIDGQSTYGHIWNFENWFNKIENFKPTYIFFYIGINERLDLMFHDNRFGIKRDLDILGKIKYYIKKNNGYSYRLARTVYQKYYLKNRYIIGNSHVIREQNYNLVDSNYNLPIEYNKYLIENLNKIYEYTIKLGSEPIFITQKTLFGKFENNNYYSIDKLNSFLREKAIAKIIIQFCNLKNLKCIDLNKDLIFSNEDMYDLVHTTPKGSEKIANYIYDEIKDYVLFR